jgi:hypothetical protein
LLQCWEKCSHKCFQELEEELEELAYQTLDPRGGRRVGGGDEQKMKQVSCRHCPHCVLSGKKFVEVHWTPICGNLQAFIIMSHF